MPTSISTTLRGRTLKGIVTTSDLVPISRLLMTPDEQAIMLDPTNPDPILAGELIQTRLQAQLDALTKQYGGGEEAKDKANETITQEWIKRLMVVCESELDLRTLILTRLMEVFPDIPTEWMWYNPTTRLAGHRLEFDELLLDLILVVYAAIAAEDGEGGIKKRMESRSTKRSIQALAEGAPPPAAAAEPATPVAVATVAPPELPIDISSMSNLDRIALLEKLTSDQAAQQAQQEAGLLAQLKTKG